MALPRVSKTATGVIEKVLLALLLAGYLPGMTGLEPGIHAGVLCLLTFWYIAGNKTGGLYSWLLFSVLFCFGYFPVQVAFIAAALLYILLERLAGRKPVKPHTFLFFLLSVLLMYLIIVLFYNAFSSDLNTRYFNLGNRINVVPTVVKLAGILLLYILSRNEFARKRYVRYVLPVFALPLVFVASSFLVFHLKAERSIEKGKPAEAVSYYNRSLKFTFSSAACFGLGDTYIGLWRLEDAAACFSRVRDQYIIKNKKATKRIEMIDKLEGIHPDNDIQKKNAIMVFIDYKTYEFALDLYQEINNMKIFNTKEYWRVIGMLDAISKRALLLDALDLYREVKNNPLNFEEMYIMHNIYKKYGEKEKLAAISAKIDKLLPENRHFVNFSDTVWFLGYDLERTGPKEFAITYYFYLRQKLDYPYTIFMHATPENPKNLNNDIVKFNNLDFKPKPPSNKWPLEEISHITRTFETNPGKYKIVFGLWYYKKYGEKHEIRQYLYNVTNRSQGYSIGWIELR